MDREPDLDAKVKLQWADGGTSTYIKVAALVHDTAREDHFCSWLSQS
eukprot:SAG11_NODE_2328_length_3514_cov_3.922694_2_plen_47_part_00